MNSNSLKIQKILFLQNFSAKNCLKIEKFSSFYWQQKLWEKSMKKLLTIYKYIIAVIK